MKRSWNWALWVGFVCAVAGLLTYAFFAQIPATRDVPWVNFILFALAGVLLVVGLMRAFGKPQRYRGKVFGTVFAVLSLVVFAFFSWIILYELKQVPASMGAPRVGQKAPDFALPDQDGKPVALADLIAAPGKGAVLIFYRGFW